MLRERHPLAAFAGTTKGNAAMLFGLAAPVVFLFAGLAVDYGSAAHLSSVLQSEADAAALAAASYIGPEDEAMAVAQTYVDNAVAKRSLTTSAVIKDIKKDSGTDEYTVKLSYNMKTRFARLAGLNSFELIVNSAAAVKAGTRVLDIALCIDATGSMQPTLDAVKANALNFYTTLNQELDSRKLQKFDAVKVRPVFFRDFGGNWKWYDVASGGQVDKYPNGFVNRPAGDAKNYGDDVPMRAANGFFNAVDQQSALQSFVTPEVESGGGDYPESGLECLNEAMNSPWTRIGDTVMTPSGNKKTTDVFSAIAIWTDQDAHPPSFNTSLLNPSYPSAAAMPRDYAGLKAKWDSESSIPQANKLLAMFMPDDAPTSGWDPVKLWPRYLAAGTLTQGTNQMVTSVVDAVATVLAKSADTHLTQ